MRFLIAALIVLLYGCPMPEVCVPNTTRCAQETNAAEYCSADSEWLTLMNCDSLGADGFSCCSTIDGCTCMPDGDEGCIR